MTGMKEKLDRKNTHRRFKIKKGNTKKKAVIPSTFRQQ